MSRTICSALFAAIIFMSAAVVQAAEVGEKPPTAKAKLEGSEVAYKMFHDALTKQLGGVAIQERDVGCVGCDRTELDPTTQKAIRIYSFIASPAMYTNFTMAFGAVTDMSLKMQFEKIPERQTDCAAGCTTSYVCPQFGNCSRQRFPCAQCP